MYRAGAVLTMVLFGNLCAFAQDPPVLAQPLTGKYLHVLGGMMVGLAAAGVVDAAIDPAVVSQYPWLLPATALAGSAAAGIAKEVLDSMGFGDPRFSDILITSAGGVAAALVSMPVINGFLVEIRRYIDLREAAGKGQL
jgi:hypothetical protein